MLPTIQSTPEAKSSAREHDALSQQPSPNPPRNALHELIEAATALAFEHVQSFQHDDGARTLLCQLCLRATTGEEIQHGAECKAGKVLAAAREIDQRIAGTAIAIFECGPPPAGSERDIRLLCDAIDVVVRRRPLLRIHPHFRSGMCGEDLYDPTLDRTLLCTLQSGHGGEEHFDEIDNLRWAMQPPSIDAPSVDLGSGGARLAEVGR
jgi:hypothetical protein